MKKHAIKTKRFLALTLALIMLAGLLPTTVLAADPVVTDSADLDIFMNIDPSAGGRSRCAAEQGAGLS